MRHFYSYGPPDCEEHFCVPRKELIRRCTQQLIGNSLKGGHYFTIWAPRQNGKTWLMREVKKQLDLKLKADFVIGMMSVQGVILKDSDPAEAFLKHIPLLIRETFGKKIDAPNDWEAFKQLFGRQDGLFDQPVVLFIDEFDSLPSQVIDLLVTLFRDMYLKRDSYLLHGLALVGVRALLGVESDRGSPFNVQRPLHAPNFSLQEVNELFNQYQEERGQTIAPEVVEALYQSVNGQPGLVCWLGELLTEKYNPGPSVTIRSEHWQNVYNRALNIEWNNTVLNLVKKAQGRHQRYVLELFAEADLKFTLDADWCNYLYLNGIIDALEKIEPSGKKTFVCRFASPFIQLRLYNALTQNLVGDRPPMLALDPLDELEDVFESAELNVTALLERYKDYLARLKAKGVNPWKDQPRRKDLHYTEAVGHFHLYHWLQNAIGRFCIISPEFPTGNGKVDLHLKCGEKSGLIEVKSFGGALQLKEARKQAAAYAYQCGFKSVAMALFAPVDDEAVLEKLSTIEKIDDVSVQVTAIGWV